MTEQQTVPFEATQMADLLSGAMDDIPPTQPSPKTPMEVSSMEPVVSPTVAEMMATPKVRELTRGLLVTIQQ